MVEAVVEFDYQATEEDELSLTKGGIISNVNKIDGGWWEGMLQGKTGLFPDNFVKELPAVKKENKSKPDLSASVKRGSAASSGSSSGGGGHVAELANKLGKEGLKVGGTGPTKRQDSKTGATAENHQSAVAGPAAAAAEAAARSSIPNRVRAADSYVPNNEDELELTVGQIINVTNKEEEGWWEGITPDGRFRVFPSNFVEEMKEEEDAGDGEFHAILGKKMKGIGFGNIFASGPVKLKGAKKQESGDSIDHAKSTPPQEAKRTSHAPAVPREPPTAPAAPTPTPAPAVKEKAVWIAIKSNSLSTLECKPPIESIHKPPPQQPFYYLTGSSVMDNFAVSSEERNEVQEMRRWSMETAEYIFDSRRRDKEDAVKREEQKRQDEEDAEDAEDEEDYDDDSIGMDSQEVFSDFDADGDVWEKMEGCARCKIVANCQAAAAVAFLENMDEINEAEVDNDHTSVDCMHTSDEEESDDGDDMIEVYIPYTDDVSNSGSKDADGAGSEHDSPTEAVDDLNLTNISELDQSNTGNLSSASDCTMPLELGSLSHALATPPPKLTFRKRRSISSPPRFRHSPTPTITVTPPLMDTPPIKNKSVSPTSTHIADREGPRGLIPLDTSSTGLFAEQLPKHAIKPVQEESSLIEELTMSSASSTYYSAAESLPLDSPAKNLSSNADDDTMTDQPDLMFSPEYQSMSIGKRVSFSPQDLYIVSSGKKIIHMPNLWEHSPLKYLRKKYPRTSSPSSESSSKPLEVEHITDSVKLARQRRIDSGPHHHVAPVRLMKHQAVQVGFLPVCHDAATETKDDLLAQCPSPVKSPVNSPELHEVDSEENLLPQYLAYSAKDRFRVLDKHDKCNATEYMERKQQPEEDLSKKQVEHGVKIKRRSSFTDTLAAAFTNKKSKAFRRSETYVPSGDASGDDVIINNAKTVEDTVEVHEEEQNSNPLNDRETLSETAFVFDPVLVPMQENKDSLFADKRVTLPRCDNASQTYHVPVKFGSDNDVSYFEFMQKRGRTSPAIQNIQKKYRLSTGRLATTSILQEEDSSMVSNTGRQDVSNFEGSRRQIKQNDEESCSAMRLSNKNSTRDLDQAKLANLSDMPGTHDNAEQSSEKVKSVSDITCEIKSLDMRDTEPSKEAEVPAIDGDDEKKDGGEDVCEGLHEIYKRLRDVQQFIRDSFEAEPEGDIVAEDISDVNMSVLDKSTNRSSLRLKGVSPIAFVESAPRSVSETASGLSRRRSRKKFASPPNVGKPQCVQIILEDIAKEDTTEHTHEQIHDNDIEYIEDTEDAHDIIASAEQEDIADVAPRRKSTTKKKLGLNKSLFHKFKRRNVGVTKEEGNGSEINGQICEAAEPICGINDIGQKPRKMSIFRRLSQRFRGGGKNRDGTSVNKKKQLKGGSDADVSRLSFADTSGLCLLDNSQVTRLSTRKELFVVSDSGDASSMQEEAQESSTEGSCADVPEKIVDTVMTEADSMKVLIDKDDQLAMDAELTGTEVDWQVLNDMLKNCNIYDDKSQQYFSKEHYVESIKDEYIDDEFNDTMELTGDLYSCNKPSKEERKEVAVETPEKNKAQLERIQEDPAYTSTPMKLCAATTDVVNSAGELSPTLEVLFSDNARSEAAGPLCTPFCSGDHTIVKSPKASAQSSYNSDDMRDLVVDSPPDKRLYYLTNHELSPSIEGAAGGDGDYYSMPVVTPQLQE